jgi:transposase-like protein
MFYRSHIPLPVWFAAIAFVMDAKKGVSALQIQRHLGIGSYETAWYMVHRIRKSMVDSCPAPLSGVIEMDETYVGGRLRGKNAQRFHNKNKEIVVGMKQRGGELRLFHSKDVKSNTLAKYIRDSVDENCETVITDELTSYPLAIRQSGIAGLRHQTVNHSAGEFVNGNITTNGIESAFSLFKRGVVGSFHRISPKHLHRYLTEFEYRFNARKDADKFGTTLKAMLDAPAMPYKQLISSVSSEI